MAGSAINLGIGGGMFSDTGLGPNQQALLDSLKQRTAMLGRPALDLNDPVSVRQEAARRQKEGDIPGAMQMLARAEQLERMAQAATERRARQNATLQPIVPNTAKSRAGRDAAVAAGQQAAELRKAGLGSTADQILAGTMQPASGDAALRQARAAAVRAQQPNSAQAKAAAKEEQKARQVEQLLGLAEELSGADKKAAENWAKAVANDGSFASAMSDVMRRISKANEEDKPTKYKGTVPSASVSDDLWDAAKKAVPGAFKNVDKDKQILVTTAILNLKASNPDRPLEDIVKEVAAEYAEDPNGNWFTRLLRFDATPDEAPPPAPPPPADDVDVNAVAARYVNK